MNEIRVLKAGAHKKQQRWIHSLLKIHLIGIIHSLQKKRSFIKVFAGCRMV